MKTPWKTDKWFTSPWNFEKDVKAAQRFPKRIKFHDVCLRDGEQQAGVEFTPKEKIKLATMLAEAGVRVFCNIPAGADYRGWPHSWSAGGYQERAPRFSRAHCD